MPTPTPTPTPGPTTVMVGRISIHFPLPLVVLAIGLLVLVLTAIAWETFRDLAQRLRRSANLDTAHQEVDRIFRAADEAMRDAAQGPTPSGWRPTSFREHW